MRSLIVLVSTLAVATTVNGTLFQTDQEVQCFNHLYLQQLYFLQSPIGMNFQKMYKLALALDNEEIAKNPSKFEDLQDKGYVPIDGLSRRQNNVADLLAKAQEQLDNDQEYLEILEDLQENCKHIDKETFERLKALVDRSLPLDKPLEKPPVVPFRTHDRKPQQL